MLESGKQVDLCFLCLDQNSLRGLKGTMLCIPIGISVYFIYFSIDRLTTGNKKGDTGKMS